jgi:hypothetical protein
MKRNLGLALALLLGLLPAAWAQTAGGNVYGTVADESGAVLPGATATLSSPQFGSRNTTTGSQGDFRFLGVDPGRYTISVTIQGFATTKREVIVNTGVNVNLPSSTSSGPAPRRPSPRRSSPRRRRAATPGPC